MKRPKGPELKAPTFLVDLYYDLLDRRLLPLVALVVVAIAAVPFLLGGGSEESPQSGAEEEAIAGAAALEGADASRLTVVEAKPGLRDYRKRLAARKPTDPFKQRYSGPVGDGQLNDQSTTSTSSSSSSTTSTTTSTGGSTLPGAPSETPAPESPPSGGGGSEGGGEGDGEPSLTLFTFAIDVQISHTETKQNGRSVMSEPTTRRKVMPTTPLPGEKAPVVTYLGVGEKGKKALLMVSNNVKSVFGDAKCLSGTDTCQLLEVEPGFPETFVYGPNDVRYKVNVLKIEPVITGKT